MDPITYPLTSDGPFSPAKEARIPVSRLRYLDGDLGWLVSKRSMIREILADPRFSARQELRSTFFASAADTPPAPPGMFIGMDPPGHTRYRRHLTGQFTVRRMRLLTEHIEQVTADYLDRMAELGPPADLVKAFSAPIPAQVICELLGAPLDYRERFMAEMMTMSRTDVSKDERTAALTSVLTYLAALVKQKRKSPSDDLLSGLIQDSDLTDEEVTNVALLLLGGGLDTTANVLALGTFALLLDKAQIPALTDPANTENAVEELLRYLPVVPGTARTALEDVEVDGVQIKAGETVMLSLPGANRDTEKFADPDTLDLHRDTHGHVAFGHGVHQCLGQQLARVEMRVAFPALFRRFPDLTLAVSPEEVPLRDDMVIFGVHSLPVTW
ncbi:cytochrome P450 [Kibdelosporangium philippinense]|uniref:Cytochrome P450 n=1 Tax=Kibdelosporangium philippinense TaxID=211113 RepID=A0ABS8Z4V5_9PSEU|nr:cytochrome P450 [Kibdelosporangium philippinense]MCE7002946.1 cytochrome P450 [Kibdelosporangium philippinense]